MIGVGGGVGDGGGGGVEGGDGSRGGDSNGVGAGGGVGCVEGRLPYIPNYRIYFPIPAVILLSVLNLVLLFLSS